MRDLLRFATISWISCPRELSLISGQKGRAFKLYRYCNQIRPVSPEFIHANYSQSIFISEESVHGLACLCVSVLVCSSVTASVRDMYSFLTLKFFSPLAAHRKVGQSKIVYENDKISTSSHISCKRTTCWYSFSCVYHEKDFISNLSFKSVIKTFARRLG